MDSSTKSEAWKAVTSSTWRADVESLIDNRLKLKGLSSLNIFLPYVALRLEKDSQITFKHMPNTDDYPSSSYWQFYSNFMQFSIKPEFNKVSLSIQLSFYAKVLPGKIKRNKNYFYRWNTKQVTISKLLATTKLDEIEKQATQLLYECSQFYFVYCEIK